MIKGSKTSVLSCSACPFYSPLFFSLLLTALNVKCDQETMTRTLGSDLLRDLIILAQPWHEHLLDTDEVVHDNRARLGTLLYEHEQPEARGLPQVLVGARYVVAEQFAQQPLHILVVGRPIHIQVAQAQLIFDIDQPGVGAGEWLVAQRTVCQRFSDRHVQLNLLGLRWVQKALHDILVKWAEFLVANGVQLAWPDLGNLVIGH